MSKDKYRLEPNEKVLLKNSCVRHGFWSAYTDELVLTTQNLIHIRRGMLGNFKGLVYYPLSSISQAIIGEASNGERQLEVYHNGEMDDFAFQSGNDYVLRIWNMAISDRFGLNADAFDSIYYQWLIDNENALSNEDDETSEFEDLRSEIEETKDEFKDAFTEIGNEFRTAFGFRPKKTRAEIRENIKKQEAEMKESAFHRRIASAQAEAFRRNGHLVKQPNPRQDNPNSSVNIDKQIETLRKLKELLDAGILTEEEFQTKKKQILQ